MEFLLPVIALLLFGGLWFSKQGHRNLEKNGIRVHGVVIKNSEYNPRDSNRLGGNINEPLVRFYTENGEEIIGQPIIGFISQTQIDPPYDVYVIYDKKDPKRFLLDLD